MHIWFKYLGSRVLPLSAIHNAITVQEEVVTVDPFCLFKRISLLNRTDEELRFLLQHELSPFPMSIFDDTGMRKLMTSLLFEAVFKASEIVLGEKNAYFCVIDGGYLLHRVVWHVVLAGKMVFSALQFVVIVVDHPARIKCSSHMIRMMKKIRFLKLFNEAHPILLHLHVESNDTYCCRYFLKYFPHRYCSR